MLSIRCIRPDGSEFLDEVTGVAYNTSKQSASGFPSVTYFIPNKDGGNNRAIDVYDGTIYVMNSSGKTIATYYLNHIEKE